MNNKNIKIISLFAFSVLFITIVAVTFAYFAPQAGGTTSTNATVTSNTTDLLTFSINRDISFTVTQNDFQENGTNQSGDATATATLTPNNKTGEATMNYYLYLNIEENPITYSEANTNGLPELMLQVFDGSNQLVTLTGLGNQVTVKGVTGYDITTLEGPITLLDNHAISASNNTATIENWRIVITLINHDFNQNDNTGKEVSAEIVIQKEKLDLGLTGTIYSNNTRVAFNNHTIEDEISNVWCVEDNGVPDCTYPYATQAYCEYWGDTCSQGTATLGVGTYETNVNTIRTKTYNVYCPIGGDYQTCTNSWYYLTEQDCLDDVDTNTYTCTAGSITRPYYLKHEVEDNIIEDTEVCLWYNNHEFCLGPNYWVETGNGGTNHQSTENCIATKNKLQTAMETALGTQADSCGSGSDDAHCDFGGFRCDANADGSVTCSDGRGSCEVLGDGTSDCIWW